MNGQEAVMFMVLVISLPIIATTGLRWLRVAQREHYIAGWVTRIGLLWYLLRPINLVLFAGVIALSVGAIYLPYLGLGAIVLAALTPLGLGLRGESAPLAWTARAKRLAVLLALLLIVTAGGLLLLMGLGGPAMVILLAPLLVDAALIPMNAIEKKLSNKFLVSARKRLQQVRPTVVAITGSYGKTSTKNYVAHVLDGTFAVVASPASFNNLMGLSRAVNDRVVPGTEVFVAEMGVYGPGEIRELSRSFPPDIAAITVIGEAHLARMGSTEVIAAAKAEITEQARTVVLPVDQPELAVLAEKCRAEGKTVITVSTVPGTIADVVVDAGDGSSGDAGQVTITANGSVASVPVTVPGVGHAVNIAVTIGIAVALGVPAAKIAGKLSALPGAQHRAEVQQTAEGVTVIDDTYNSNPTGAARALHGAAALAAEAGAPLVVVTPGMVELGSVQVARNTEFARAVATAGGHLLAVGRTNRAALCSGAAGSEHPVLTFTRRDAAVQAALKIAGQRGVILYENDLPDHYP